ncbi:MAG: hypothetical protein P8074_05130 [Anaerolineales bacterium]
MTQSGVTLQQLLVYVERAVRGDRKLLVQLQRTFQQMTSHPGVPTEERLLGSVLIQVLMGDRDPVLTELPEDAAQEVTQMLQRLRN